MLWVGLQCVIVVFPDYTHLYFESFYEIFVVIAYALRHPFNMFSLLSGARCLKFGICLPLHSYFLCVSNEYSGERARLCLRKYNVLMR